MSAGGGYTKRNGNEGGAVIALYCCMPLLCRIAIAGIMVSMLLKMLVAPRTCVGASAVVSDINSLLSPSFDHFT